MANPIFRPLLPSLLAVGLVLGGAVETASAQGVPEGCRPSNPNAGVGGAVIGGIAGAVLGAAVAGKHNKTEGAAVGGIGGAALGAVIGSSQNQPCPEGYVYAAPPPGPEYAPAPPPPPPPPPRPAYAYPDARPGEFWYGAPWDMRARITFTRNQIVRIDQDGWLSPRERDRLFRRLDEIARMEDRMRYEDNGYLGPDHVRRLEQELNELSRRAHWDEYVAEHPPTRY